MVPSWSASISRDQEGSMTRGEGGGGHTAERGGERRRRRSRYKKDSMSVGNGPIRTGAHRYRVSFPIKVRTGPSIVVHNPTHWPTHWSPRYRVSFPINSLSIFSTHSPPLQPQFASFVCVGRRAPYWFFEAQACCISQGARDATRFTHLDSRASCDKVRTSRHPGK